MPSASEKMGAKHAQAVAHVLQKVIEQVEAARVAAFFFEPDNAAQLAQSLGPGLFRGKSGGGVLFDEAFQMELKFFIEIALHAAARKQRTEKAHDVRPP
jgi:hypothetical protein